MKCYRTTTLHEKCQYVRQPLRRAVVAVELLSKHQSACGLIGRLPVANVVNSMSVKEASCSVNLPWINKS